MDGEGCPGSCLGLLLQGCSGLLSSTEARGMLSQGASSLVPTACFLGLCTNGKCDELLCQTTCTATTNYMNFIFMHGHSSLGNGTSQNRLLLWACILLFYVLQRCTLLHTHIHTHVLLFLYILQCCTLLHTHILLLYILQGCALLHTNVRTHTHFSSMSSSVATSYTHILLLYVLQGCALLHTHIYTQTHTHIKHTYAHTTHIHTQHTYIYTSPLHPPKTAPSYTHTHTHTHTHPDLSPVAL